MRNIRQNLFFAFVYNVLGVPVAAGVLYPAFGLLLSPILASAAMTFSSVSVIGNALRLRRQNARLALALSNTPQGLCMWDPSARLLVCIVDIPCAAIH